MERINRENDPKLAYEGGWLAMQYVNTIAKSKNLPNWEQVIKTIHSKVLGPALLPEYREGFAGQYRTTNAYILNGGAEIVYWYELSEKMAEYGKETDERLKSMKPGAKSIGETLDHIAWAHYNLVTQHPFIDGNGRTARQSTDLLLKRFEIKPLLLGPVHKRPYLDALEKVNQTNDIDHLTLFFTAHLYNEYSRGESEIDKAYTFSLQEKIKQLNAKIIERKIKSTDTTTHPYV